MTSLVPSLNTELLLIIVLHTIRRRKANWTGHILRRNCLLKHITEGKIRGTRRRGRRRKQLLGDRKEARRYWKLKEEAQDRTLWRTQFGRGYGLSQDRLLLDLTDKNINFQYCSHNCSCKKKIMVI
jgi:hypothetical protein